MAFDFGTAPIGTIIPFAGKEEKIPPGWLLCDGSWYKVGDYYDLFTVIDHNYSNKNVVFGNRVPVAASAIDAIQEEMFAVPDLRGRTTVGAGRGYTYPLGQVYCDNNFNGNSGEIIFYDGSFENNSDFPDSIVKVIDTNVYVLNLGGVLQKVNVIAVGGGGGGAASEQLDYSVSGSSVTFNGGGGGGGGGTEYVTNLEVAGGGEITITVGKGGSSSYPNDGGPGGDSMITGLSRTVTAKGGGGGSLNGSGGTGGIGEYATGDDGVSGTEDTVTVTYLNMADTDSAGVNGGAGGKANNMPCCNVGGSGGVGAIPAGSGSVPATAGCGGGGGGAYLTLQRRSFIIPPASLGEFPSLGWENVLVNRSFGLGAKGNSGVVTISWVVDDYIPPNGTTFRNFALGWHVGQEKGRLDIGSLPIHRHGGVFVNGGQRVGDSNFETWYQSQFATDSTGGVTGFDSENGNEPFDIMPQMTIMNFIIRAQ